VTMHMQNLRRAIAAALSSLASTGPPVFGRPRNVYTKRSVVLKTRSNKNATCGGSRSPAVPQATTMLSTWLGRKDER
jgi:hypothetical protein